ncbi:hypothetical protein CTAYLR_001066 [Chrysophaeum taylorii]|uniref:Uncharacterized protein n=1 Tax=Chrysophaeum taylorii TaxID=2483200 RepID=A0AAD7UHI3_9STRA|nr:hypothetical protein CTAYLR_001066 [Chrysophaeum taylorii]
MSLLAGKVRPLAARLTPARFMGTTSSKPAAERTFKESWLSDPATYPILIIISGAMCFCTAVGLRCLFTNPDVRINKTKRSQIIRDWS